MARKENEETTEATKAAKEIEKKSRQGYLDDIKKTWRDKPLHGRYPLRIDNGNVDRTSFSSSSLNDETKGSISAA